MDIEADSDHHLALLACRSGEAFAELYRRFHRRVYAYLFARTGSIPDAQDLTSVTFMAALDGIARFRAEGTFAAWLLTIAHRKMVDHYRRRKPQDPIEWAERYPDGKPSPEQAAYQVERRQQIRKALQSLTEERSTALGLRFFSGLSNAEVAMVMGKNETAVKMLIYRGLQDLRNRLPITELEEE